MRGLVFVACLGLVLGPVTDDARAERRAPAPEPEFRLLELGGRTVRWSVPAEGLPATITYAFLTERRDFPGARNCDAMLPPEAALDRSRIDRNAFRAEVRAAFALWQEAANVAFREVPVSEAGILIGADAKNRGRAFTNVALKAGADRDMGEIGQSLICLNPHQPWKIGFDGNLDVYDLRFTMAHEIGHAIGLDHPGPEGQLMSFRYLEKGRGLTAGDIAGAHALYGRKGAAPSARAASSHVPTNAAASTAAPPLDRIFGLGAREAANGRR